MIDLEKVVYELLKTFQHSSPTLAKMWEELTNPQAPSDSDVTQEIPGEQKD